MNLGSLSVDVEPDCPPYRSTFEGVIRGLPILIDLLQEEGVQATFFVTGEVARRFPHALERVASAGHEIGSHGDRHRSFRAMSMEEAHQDLAASIEALRGLGPVRLFRAPFLQFPKDFLPLLPELGIRIDSSLGRYKPTDWEQLQCPCPVPGLIRVPVSLTSSMLRLPCRVSELVLHLPPRPIVLFVHSWEFLDWSSSDLRWDCRFATGSLAAERFRAVIHHLKGMGIRLVPIGQLAD